MARHSDDGGHVLVPGLQAVKANAPGLDPEAIHE